MSLALFGLFWRRLLGISAWMGLKRSLCFIIGFLTVLGFLVFFGIDKWLSLGIAAVSIGSFSMGHEWTDTKKLIVRYGVPSFVLSFVVAYYGYVLAAFLFLLVGPLTAGSYWLVQLKAVEEFLKKYTPVYILDKENAFLDGNICFAEMLSGYWMFLAIEALVW